MSEITMEAAQAWLNQVSEKTGNYAGIPMPLEGVPLVVHAGHPLQAVYQPDMDKPIIGDHITIDGVDWTFYNAWYSNVRKCTVMMMRNPAGLVRMLRIPSPKGFDLLAQTMAAAAPWTLTAETKALEKLAGLISHRQLELYILTGGFVESSKKSKVTYLFRRCRPTIAVRETNGQSRVLCSLCLHPIGFYQGSHAGVMVPTDDVIAHLLKMRACEHRFWKQANQHPEGSPLAGLGI